MLANVHLVFELSTIRDELLQERGVAFKEIRQVRNHLAFPLYIADVLILVILKINVDLPKRRVSV